MRAFAWLVALLLANVDAEAQSWITYTSDAGRYRIDMPAQPHVHAETLPYKGGLLNIGMAFAARPATRSPLRPTCAASSTPSR